MRAWIPGAPGFRQGPGAYQFRTSVPPSSSSAGWVYWGHDADGVVTEVIDGIDTALIPVFDVLPLPPVAP